MEKSLFKYESDAYSLCDTRYLKLRKLQKAYAIEGSPEGP